MRSWSAPLIRQGFRLMRPSSAAVLRMARRSRYALAAVTPDRPSPWPTPKGNEFDVN